jgi:hypothetical protein
VIVEPVEVCEKEGFAPEMDFGNGSAKSEARVVLGQGKGTDTRGIQEKVVCVKFVAGQDVVETAVELVGAGLGGVGYDAATGVPVLRGKGVYRGGHLLHRGIGNRAFVRLMVSFGVTVFGAVEPTLPGDGLAAVNARFKRVAPEDGVAVGRRGDVTRRPHELGFG